MLRTGSRGRMRHGGPAPAGSISITTPKQYQMHQRVTTQGSIAITGTYSGAVSGPIEASFNGGAYQTIVASPTGGTFSGTLTGQNVGQGTLTVRFQNFPAVNASKGTVGIGDIYVIIGDSNHSGRATTSTVQATSNNGLVGIQYGNDGVWKPHQENTSATGAFDDPAGAIYGNGSTSAAGSYFGALSTLIMNNANMPVAFVCCGIGSTNLQQWSDVGHGANPFWQYGIALSRATAMGLTHKACLCLLGTNAVAAYTTVQDFEDAYNRIINAWKAATGAKTVVYRAVQAQANNNTAVANVLATNADALAGPDFVGAWSGTHYLTAADINVAAGRAWTALQALFYP